MYISKIPGNGTRPALRRSRGLGLSRRLLIAATMPACLGIVHSARAADETSTWFGGIGNWSDATKWSNVPVVVAFPNNGNFGKTYDAVVNAGTITLDQDISIQSLTFNNATITGGNLLTLSGASTWSGGSMSGTGTTRIATGGTLSFALGSNES